MPKRSATDERSGFDVPRHADMGEALEWWRKAYETLSAMKQRGIMLPTDEQYLEQLRQKISGP